MTPVPLKHSIESILSSSPPTQHEAPRSFPVLHPTALRGESLLPPVASILIPPLPRGSRTSSFEEQLRLLTAIQTSSQPRGFPSPPLAFQSQPSQTQPSQIQPSQTQPSQTQPSQIQPSKSSQRRPRSCVVWTNMPAVCKGSTTVRPTRERPRSGEVKSRTQLTPAQRSLLEGAFANDNYLTPTRRRALSEETGLLVPTVAVWFQNRRRIEKKKANNIPKDIDVEA